MKTPFAALSLLALLAAAPALAQTAPPAAAGSSAPAVTAPAVPAKPAAPAATTGTTAAQTLVDINSASKEDLAKLTGIGPVRAEAIVKGRPYKGKDELVQKGVIPDGVYGGIKDQIVARQKS